MPLYRFVYFVKFLIQYGVFGRYELCSVVTGEDITNAKGKRNLSNEASRHVEPFSEPLYLQHG